MITISNMKLLVLSLLIGAAVANTTETSLTENLLNEGPNEETGNDNKRPSGTWQTYNGRSFMFIARSMTWASAQIHCLALGGSLASIHDVYEETFVRRLARGRYSWIGLSDAQNEGYWLWINSDPLTYTKWCRGEPNNYGGQQHCAAINHSRNKCWDDANCNVQYPFVCVQQ